MIERSQSEIDDVRGVATDAMDAGSKYPGMSYEEGIIAALDWATGESDDNPMEDE
jgi:hypothetical protein